MDEDVDSDSEVLKMGRQQCLHDLNDFRKLIQQTKSGEIRKLSRNFQKVARVKYAWKKIQMQNNEAVGGSNR